MLELTALDLGEIATALEDQDYEHRWLINRETGEILFWTSFKDELHEEYPHLVPIWYAFRDARAQHRAVEWLRDNDLVTAADAERFLADHPEPTVS